MHERTWQFRLHDENVIDCASYFGKRAGEVAAALNCQLVASNVVKIALGITAHDMELEAGSLETIIYETMHHGFDG